MTTLCRPLQDLPHFNLVLSRIPSRIMQVFPLTSKEASADLSIASFLGQKPVFKFSVKCHAHLWFCRAKKNNTKTKLWIWKLRVIVPVWNPASLDGWMHILNLGNFTGRRIKAREENIVYSLPQSQRHYLKVPKLDGS